VIPYLYVTLPVFTIGALAFWWAGRTVSATVRHERWMKFITYVAIVHGVLLATILGTAAITALVVVIAVAGAIELGRLVGRLRPGTLAVAAIVYLLVAWRAITLASAAPPAFVAYLYLVVAVFDGFSQASGQIAGRRRLAPSISPSKTVEGLAIGAAITVACAFGLRSLALASMRTAALVGAVTVVAGLAGDLGASWVKRRAGVKDYGAILPGHGGVLDRFDSFLAVAAALSCFAVVVTSGLS